MPGGLEIDLELGTEHPLSVRYDFADGDGAVEYLVSPRIAAH
jgi:proliferating cell nuclear antigen